MRRLYGALFRLALAGFFICGALALLPLLQRRAEQAAFARLAPPLPAPAPALPNNAAQNEPPPPRESPFPGEGPLAAEGFPAPQAAEQALCALAAHCAALKAQNPDFAAWLTLPGTGVSYPVMATPAEPEHYLRRAFSGRPSGSGTPFVGAGCSLSPRTENLLVYGHNLRGGGMFAPLTQYARREFFALHPLLYLATPERVEEYRVFAAFYAPAAAPEGQFCFYGMARAESDAEYEAYVAGAMAASLWGGGAAPAAGTPLLTLVTCAAPSGEGRFVVMAARTGVWPAPP